MPLLFAALALSPAAFAQDQTPAAAMPAHKPVPASHGLNVIVEGRVTTLTIEDLTALPQVTLHVHNAHSNGDETYSGPLLADVLAKGGLTLSSENQHMLLHSALVATGTDNYYVLYAGAEAFPDFSKGQIIVAIMKSGLPDTDGGLIQLINNTDKKPARWVHGLQNLSLMTISQNPGH
ncbi:MAG: hypothetical protein PW735_11670 [Acidobacteriaceae bacterium]|nr:hypothetical protein [Acidobacteriaceae bacterium]